MSDEEIIDYFIAVVPEAIDVNDVAQYDAVIQLMEREAHRATMGQYRKPPRALLMGKIDWLVTNSAEEVERHQPDHDCDECRAGNQRAREFLLANPGRFVACGNLHYTEVW